MAVCGYRRMTIWHLREHQRAAGGQVTFKLKQNERLASSEKSDREDITCAAAMRRKGNGEPGGNETEKQSREQEENKNEGKENDRESDGRKGERARKRERWEERETRRKRAGSKRARKRG